MNNIGNIELVYSLFNQYLFQEAKNNIDLVDLYYRTNPATLGNGLVSDLIDSIRKYPLESIDEPLFRSILVKQGKTSKESDEIIKTIIKYKMYDSKAIDPARKYLRGICSSSIIKMAENKFQNDPEGFIKYLKNSDYKSDYSDLMSIENFNQIDINSILASTGKGFASRYDWINRSFDPLMKYEAGQICIVAAPPGCFTGDTRVRLSDGTRIKFKNLMDGILEGKEYYTFCKSTSGEVRETKIKDCWITKKTNKLIEVSISNGSKVRCTPDHKFLMENGTYKEAKDLSEGDILMDYIPNHIREMIRKGQILVKISLTYVQFVSNITLSEEIPVYDLEVEDESHNFLLDSEVFVHNCGKSLFCMGEALTMAMAGAKVHYIALGDLKPKDFVVRMGAVYSGASFADVQLNLQSIYKALNNAVGDRLGLTIVPSAKVSADQYIEYIKDKDYDVLFIDYDSNFLSSAADNLYSEYGKIYDRLTELSGLGKLVFIASQPTKPSWKYEEINMEDIGESARKVHSADVIITIGRVITSRNHLGIMKIAKNRRGEEGVAQPYIRLNNGRFIPLPDEVYENLKQIKDKRMFSEGDINQLIIQNSQLKQAAMDSIMKDSGVPVDFFQQNNLGFQQTQPINNKFTKRK